MTYTVKAEEIRKSFGGKGKGAKVVLDGVDLAVETGSIFALLGPNGAGKTTLVRILATLIRPDGGTATVAGRRLLTHPGAGTARVPGRALPPAPAAVRRSISLTGQYAAVDDILTGDENLRM